MLTAVAGILGILVIGSWAVVAWGSQRRQPWLLAPLALLIVVLVATGHGGWAFVPIAALMGFSFAELVIGSREAPTLRARDQDAPLSTERWAAAVAAPFRVAVAEPWDVISRPQLRRRYRKVLEEEWGITDRAGLVATVERLWEELHSRPRADLVVDLRTGVARTRPPGGGDGLGDADDDEGPDGPGGSEDARPEQRVLLTPDQVARMREVTGAGEDAESVVVGSYEWWKSAHLVRLACGGATLNWLSRAETLNLLRRVSSDLQRRFSSWERLSAAFHGGYLLWRGGAGGEGEPDRVWTALGILTSDDDSPWRLLPWDMPLERVPYEPSGAGEGSPVLPGAVPPGPSDGGRPAGGPGGPAEEGAGADGAAGTGGGDGGDGAGEGAIAGAVENGAEGAGAGSEGPVRGAGAEEAVSAVPEEIGPSEGLEAGPADAAGSAEELEEPPRPRAPTDASDAPAEGDGAAGSDDGPFGGVEGGAAGARRR